MFQLRCGLGMEKHLVKDFLCIKQMEINKLVDLNNFRTAPKLSDRQEKKLLEELEANIFNADWITIGIMAPSDNKAIEAYFLEIDCNASIAQSSQGAIIPIVIQSVLKIFSSSSSNSFST